LAVTLVALPAARHASGLLRVIGVTTAIVLAGVGARIPDPLYRSSRSWWLMNYYLLFPHHLPANGGKGRVGEDDNV
jgi:hypothetical protein